eukprot:gene4986-21354_t
MVARCALVNCSTYKSKEVYPLLSFHKIPPSSTKCQKKKAWRTQLIKVVNRCDPSFNSEAAFICSRHFKPECFKTGKTGRKDLIVGSIPTEFLAEKSIITPKPKPRRHIQRSSLDETQLPYKYLNFSDLKKDLKKIKAPWVTIVETENYIKVALINHGQIDLNFSVDESLEFLVETNFNELPVDHLLYKNYKHSICRQRIHWLLSEIQEWHICLGITDRIIKEHALRQGGQKKSEQLIFIKTKVSGKIVDKVYSKHCNTLVKSSESCTECRKIALKIQRQLDFEKQSVTKQISLKSPLTRVAKRRLVVAVQILRQKEKKLEATIQQLEREIRSKGIFLDNEVHADLTKIIDNVSSQFPENSFEKLFWKEQCKAFQSSDKGLRWHPMMIRFALHLHMRSPSTYRALKQSLVLKLPSERTLRDYSNIVHPSVGFRKEVLDDLKDQTEKLHGIAKKSSGFDGKVPSVASHALVFMICGIASSLKFSLGYFATRTATCGMLYPLMWQAVGFCETYVGLKVIAVVCDKATSNQKLFKIHGQDKEITHKTINVFSGAEKRPLFFFSDPPHLLKTARNNLANSGFGKKRLMWNEKDIVWSHVVDVYESDRKCMVRKLPKLTNEHIYLNPYSKMRVNLAAQVMSETVGKVMVEYGPTQASATANYILMIDKFFDLCNVRSLTEGDHKIKPFLKPYKDINDERFRFIQDEFFVYLNRWKDAVKNRKGNFSDEDRRKMFLSEATYEGLQTTALSLVECVRYLLQNGFKYVLTNRFCQDPLEDHFGRHRGLGRRSTNPNISSFGFQENKFRIQRSIATSITPKGNTKGIKRPAAGITITTSPLKRRKK